MEDKNMDFSRISEDEKINGIKITNVPKYIREKAYITDFSETLAQLAEMTIQLGVNMGLSPEDALLWARKLQDIDAQLAQKAEQANLEIEKARIDNLITLPDGSTTNDARLEDIAVGADGKTYESPGEAVRSVGKRILTDFENKVSNGNFVNRVGWVQLNSTTTATDNILKIQGDGSNKMPRVTQETGVKASANRKVYVRGLFKSLNNDAVRIGFALYGSNSSNIVQYSRIDGVITGKQYLQTDIIELPSEVSGNLVIQIRAEYNSPTLATGKTVEVGSVALIDLTSIFGYGKEPTKEQMDEIFESTGWFDGRIDINKLQKASTQVSLNAISSVEEKLSNYTMRVINELPVDKNAFDSDKKEVYRFTSAELRYSGSSLETDENIKFEGSNTVKLTSNNGTNAIALFNLNKTLDLSNHDYIDIYMHVNEITNLGSTQIDLMSSSSLSNKFSFYPISGRLSEVKESGWRYLRIPKNDFKKEGAIDWSNIQFVRVVTRSNYSNALEVNLGKIEAAKVDKGAISLYFDDGTEGQYKNAFRIMEKYGLKGVIDVVTSWVGQEGYVTWSQLREMENAGWIVCSHTHTHQRLYNLSDEEREFELKKSQEMLLDRGFYLGAKCLVVPFGAYSTAVDEIAKKYYTLVRSYTYESRENPSMEFMQSHRRNQKYLSPYNTDDIGTMTGWVDNVIDKKEELSIAFHRVDDSATQYTTPIDVFEEFCVTLRQKVDEGKLDVVTWKDTMTQSPVVNPIDLEGNQYIVSGDGKPTILTLPFD